MGQGNVMDASLDQGSKPGVGFFPNREREQSFALQHFLIDFVLLAS